MDNNMNRNNANSGNGINISNLLDLRKLGNMFQMNKTSRGGGMQNPLSVFTNLFKGNINNKNRQQRCTIRVLPIEEAYRRIKACDCFLLDVRTEMEYNTIRIKGSVNIPLDRLNFEMQQVLTNKEECIIVYCATGSRVRRAIQILWSLGYTNVFIWEGAGINTFAFQDLIVYNDFGKTQNKEINNSNNSNNSNNNNNSNTQGGMYL